MGKILAVDVKKTIQQMLRLVIFLSFLLAKRNKPDSEEADKFFSLHIWKSTPLDCSQQQDLRMASHIWQ